MASADPQIKLPQQPAIVAGLKSCAWLSPDGEIEHIDSETARDRIGNTVTPIVCHARSTARRLYTAPFPALDILELFAFTYPARFALPTPIGIAEALGQALPSSTESAAVSLIASARAMLSDLGDDQRGGGDAIAIATAMVQSGWAWGPAVLTALGAPEGVRQLRAAAASGDRRRDSGRERRDAVAARCGRDARGRAEARSGPRDVDYKTVCSTSRSVR